MSAQLERGSDPRLAPAWLIPVGALISFLGAMCGVGGGLFVVPLLHYALGFEIRAAVATSVVHVLVTAAASTATELVHPADVLQWNLIAVLGAGALTGAELGYRLSKRVNGRLLRLIFGSVALVAGGRVLFEDSSGAEAVTSAALVLPYWGYFLAFGAGFLGGTLTPLLGLGGGLIFVPALHLGLPQVSFNAVRASSLAVVMLSSSRSIWLYLRERVIQGPTAFKLGIGAAVGSVAGVLVVHDPLVVRWAQVLLGLMLWLVAARFFFDLWRHARLKQRARSIRASGR